MNPSRSSVIPFNALLECVQITHTKAEHSVARSMTGPQIILYNDLAVILTF